MFCCPGHLGCHSDLSHCSSPRLLSGVSLPPSCWLSGTGFACTLHLLSVPKLRHPNRATFSMQGPGSFCQWPITLSCHDLLHSCSLKCHWGGGAGEGKEAFPQISSICFSLEGKGLQWQDFSPTHPFQSCSRLAGADPSLTLGKTCLTR